ncbi:MAG: Macrolide export ATP-binding/permease protein MacB [Verrucomicrobia subdivision 3 bacterium]|nr:Macrolide export ATP-binding/permease protein MacB [Limisphaerales bacterium]MCS1414362.1 Macrolide export ATP-binding/permease protein MacB [Limisphaerales bacterium]
MRFFAILRIALNALTRNKLRTILTMLGIIIGVGAVIAMVSIGNGARAELEAQIAGMGQNIIMVFPNFRRGGVSSGGGGGGGGIKLSDADAILNEVPGVVAVSPEVTASGQVIFGNQNWFSSVYGVSAEYLQIKSWDVESGSMFTTQHVQSAAKVALLGSTVVTELFEGGDLIGEVIRIRNVPFTVIGTLKAKGTSLVGLDQDDRIIVPYTSAMKRLTGDRNRVRRINIQAESPAMMPMIQEEMTRLLRQRHRLPEGMDDDFMIRTQDEINEFATGTSKTMTALLGAVAGVSLVVGGIGIMNIMLVSVTERTREIGIRMSVGAKARDILFQFLTEAVVLSALGGILGIAIGMKTSTIISNQMDWPTLTPTDAIVGAFLFSAAIGIFFGFYPARKAAHLDPIESLRYE